MSKVTANYDESWKEALSEYFDSFLSFEYDISDGEVNLKFPSVKLLDYESRWDELESSNNPFAMITMAHLKTLATTRNLVERAERSRRHSASDGNGF